MINGHRVFDCFSFYNELDMLEIRLNVLDEVVDYFVIAESSRTFTGRPKALFFNENRKRYKKFLHKIRHIVIDDSEFDKDTEVWQREFDQKNCVLRGLDDCTENDYIIISDLDEIINPEVIFNFVGRHSNSIGVIKQSCYYYYLNCLSSEVINVARIAKFNLLKSPQQIRAYPKFSKHSSSKFERNIFKWIGSIRKRLSLLFGSYQIIEDGGWHFTYLKSADAIRDKIKDFSHTEFDDEEYTSLQSIKSRIDNLQDPFDRNYHLKKVEINNSYPKYIRDNQEKYSHLILK